MKALTNVVTEIVERSGAANGLMDLLSEMQRPLGIAVIGGLIMSDF